MIVMVVMCVHMPHDVHLEVRGQLCSVGSFLPSYVGSGDQTEVLRLEQQTPLPAEPSHFPLTFQSVSLAAVVAVMILPSYYAILLLF